VILWPVGMALVATWLVFRDPAIDHRVVVFGALLPDLVDAPFGGARLLHSVAASAALLVVVMLATRGRRHARRRWLFLPVGTFLHLVFDAMWTRNHTFWWPAFGWSLEGPLPALDHGTGVLVVEELAGALALAWFWRRFHLAQPALRAAFVRTGRLARDA
jgi:membrane-bound metal-dependent hydrolase YbcI (DUF457 family)